jgi:FkbM family methyltransferase
VLVPWGDWLWVDTQDMIGSAIARLGVHELAVTETIYRLVGPGDTAIDVGANLGYYTSLLTHRVGPAGMVHAFEPHPVVYERLLQNVVHLSGAQAYRRAVSDRQGDGFLNQPDEFAVNMGTASVADRGIPIALATLDAAIPDEPIGLIKIDVEGHEFAALRGAARTLARTRHVIFEEHARLPTPVTDTLKSSGFQLYGIAETWRGPQLVGPQRLELEAQWEAPNYLATRDPRVQEAVKPDGWRCLRSSRRNLVPRMVTGAR